MAAAQLPDVELLALAREGDPCAFQELCDRHRQAMLAEARRIVRHEQDAEDIVSKAYLRFCVNVRAGRVTTGPRPWLLKVVKRLALDDVRSAYRRHTVQPEVQAASGEPLREVEIPNSTRKRTMADDLNDQVMAIEIVRLALHCKDLPHRVLCFLLVNLVQYFPGEVADERSQDPLRAISDHVRDHLRGLWIASALRQDFDSFEDDLQVVLKRAKERLQDYPGLANEERSFGATKLEEYYKTQARPAEITMWWDRIAGKIRRQFARSGGGERCKSAGAGG
ncbi:MAG: sigma factor [Bryobacteraceae bacterium]